MAVYVIAFCNIFIMQVVKLPKRKPNMKLLRNNIFTMDDWKRISPPMGGDRQWKDGRSAKELARYITSALPNVPCEVEAVLSNFVSENSVFEWAAEYVTDFSTHELGRGEGRNHDAMMANDEIFVGIEGKADESLGSQYIGTALVGASNNKKHRINGMIKMLYGDSPENHKNVRYQLVTASSACLLEAKDRKLNKAMLMVIVFKKSGCYRDEKIAQNDADINYFLSHSKAYQKGNYWLIPTAFGNDFGIELFFSKITVELP